MKQDEVFAKVKDFSVRHSFLVANPLTERLSPILGAVSVAAGFVTNGRVPRSYENLVAGTKAVAAARGKNEHPNILAWQISSNQIRNNLLGLRVLTRNDTTHVVLDLPPETQDLKNKKGSFMIVAFHSLGEVLFLSKINELLANSNGVLLAVAPQPDAAMEKLTSKAAEYGLTVANTGNSISFLKQCITMVRNGGVASFIEGTKPNQDEPMIPVDFLNQQVLLRENIYKLAAILKIPIVPAISTLENGHVKAIAGRPIQTEGRKPQDIAQEWAKSMSKITEQYPTSVFAFFELKFTTRR